MHQTKWTLVQHTGYSVAGDPDFEHAVEERAVTTKAKQQRVIAAGGLLFDSYREAADAAEEHNYPPGHEGLIPRAAGTFGAKVDRERIYVPATAVPAVAA